MVSLVLSRLDYCNSVLAGLPDYCIKRLKRVQNCAAKVCFRQKRNDHKSPLLFKLHWLPVRERIDFKIATFCYNALNGCSPLYISSLLEKPIRVRQFITPDLFLDSHVTAFFYFFHWLQRFTPPAFFVIQQKSLPYTAIRPLR